MIHQKNRGISSILTPPFIFEVAVSNLPAAGSLRLKAAALFMAVKYNEESIRPAHGSISRTKTQSF